LALFPFLHLGPFSFIYCNEISTFREGNSK